MIWTILAAISIGFFIGYNIACICTLKKLPYSLSGTYYLLNEKQPGAGISFTIMMLVVFLLLIAPWMWLSGQISTLGSYLTILAFITCGCMCFVGIAPNIRTSKRIERIHIISAAVGAVAALLWVFIVCWKIAYIFPAWVLLCGGIAHLTKTAKSCRDYWLELTAFGTVFTAIIVEMSLVYGS